MFTILSEIDHKNLHIGFFNSKRSDFKLFKKNKKVHNCERKKIEKIL